METALHEKLNRGVPVNPRYTQPKTIPSQYHWSLLGGGRNKGHNYESNGQGALYWVLYVLLSLLVLGALTLLILHVVWYPFHSSTQHLHRDIKNLRAELNQHHEPIGFSASKNGQQFIPNNVSTIITTWTISGGWPAYDDTDGAMNLPTGIFKSANLARYEVDGTLCWKNPSNDGPRELRLVTSGNAGMTVFDRAQIDTNVGPLGAHDCLHVSQIMMIPVNGSVWLEGFTDTISEGGENVATQREKINDAYDWFRDVTSSAASHQSWLTMLMLK